jgi:hypothetical protein
MITMCDWQSSVQGSAGSCSGRLRDEHDRLRLFDDDDDDDDEPGA